MLQQFSWGHFLVALLVLNLIWYGLVVLIFYREEVLEFLGGVGSNSALSHAPNQASFGNSKTQSQNEAAFGAGEQAVVSLIGTSKLPDGVEVLSSSQVAFSGGDAVDKYEQVGLVADVVQELKIIFLELEKNAGDKRDFFTLLDKLKQEYGPLSGHPSLTAINGFIARSAGFHLTRDEMDNLWY